MLLKFFKGLMGSQQKTKPSIVAPPPVAPVPQEAGIDKSNPRFQRIAREELAKCPYIRKEAIESVFLYILDQQKLFETKTPLSVEEKRDLGVNTRLKITKEMVAVLTTEGLQSHYPAEIVPNLWRSTTFRYRRIMDVERLRNMQLCETVKFQGVMGLDSCEWCKKVEGKSFDINEDIDRLLEDNCKCEPYWKGYLSPNLTAI